MNINCIEVKSVSKSFLKNNVLKDISLNISTGEIFGLLGPSGAGKTTFIKIITGQLAADSGTVKVLGTNVKDFDKSMYLNFGMVLDNTGFYKRLTAYDNLKVFSDIYQIPYSNIDVILEDVGLIKARKTTVANMSKGMVQRLGLARALLHNPKILFLDEPTSGLDPKTAKSIHKLILKEKNKGTVIFLTTHNMQEAYELCDNLALINEGSIVEEGNPKDICKRYNHENEIIIETKSGLVKKFTNSSKASTEIEKLFSQDDVLSIHSTEPTLETVFLELTGRNLDSYEDQ